MLSADKRWNLIGFNFSNYEYGKEYQHCPIHGGIRLLKTDDPNMLKCPTCGNVYKIKDTVTDQDIKSNVPPAAAQTTKIISARRKRQYYDVLGNPIPSYDKEAMQDLAEGRKIVYYNEWKVEEPKPQRRRLRRYGKQR